MGVNTLGAAAGTRTAASGRGGRRSRAGRARRHDVLLHNGHLLTISSLVASGLGAGYWMFVTRWYDPEDVGRGYSAVSAMMFLAGLGQLNLANTLIRFVPSAGPRTRRLVVRIYLAAVVVSLILAIGFVLAIPLLAPQLHFLRAPLSAAGFIGATAAYAVFVIQDGALTGLRRADFVVFENALFAVVKVGFLLLFTEEALGGGILLSWYAALAVSIAVTSVFLFARAIPAHARSNAPPNADASTPTLGYLAADLAGSLCWLAAITLPPLLVLRVLGPAQSAYFSLCWVIGYALYLLSTNMGASLIVETVTDSAQTGANARRVLRHTAVLVSTCVLVLVVCAPRLLAMFGPGYAQNGTGLLRLLALSAIPNLVLSTVVAVSRSRRRLSVAVGTLVSVCVLAMSLTVLLLRHMGIAGAGVGWLAAQCTVASVLLARRSWWLDTRSRPTSATTATVGDLGRAALVRLTHVAYWPGDRVAALRLLRQYTRRPAPIRLAKATWRAQRSHSDLLVVRAVGLPRAALKAPRTEQARTGLARQTKVLDRLWSNEDLGGWRLLIPQIIVRAESTRDSSVAEHWILGVTGSQMLRERPLEATRLVEAAVRALAPLHSSNGRFEWVGSDHLARWTEPSLEALERLLRQSGADASAVEVLKRRLYRRLDGRGLEIGWTHRDFHPSNVLFRAGTHEVSGIVDWGGAIPDGPTAVDAVMYALTTSHETSGRSIGELVAAAMTTDVPEDGLLLLAWLWHVTDNLEKSGRYRRNRRWIADNVLRVLSTLKTVEAFKAVETVKVADAAEEGS